MTCLTYLTAISTAAISSLAADAHDGGAGQIRRLSSSDTAPEIVLAPRHDCFLTAPRSQEIPVPPPFVDKSTRSAHGPSAIIRFLQTRPRCHTRVPSPHRERRRAPAEPGDRGDRQQHVGDLVLTRARASARPALHSGQTAGDPIATNTATCSAAVLGSRADIPAGPSRARPGLRRSIHRSSPACAKSPGISPSGPYTSARRAPLHPHRRGLRPPDGVFRDGRPFQESQLAGPGDRLAACGGAQLAAERIRLRCDGVTGQDHKGRLFTSTRLKLKRRQHRG